MMATLILAAELLLLLLLILLGAFFSSAETALFSLNAIQVQRLHTRNPRRGALVAELLREPNRILSTILVGNTLANVAVATLGYALIDRIPSLSGFSAAVAIPVMTLLNLILSEVAPKRVAIAHAERLAPIFAVLLGFWIRALAPLCLLLDGLARWLRPSLRPERKTLSDEELRTAVELSAEQGALDEEERTMVDGILRLSEMQVSDVMTPRVDMVGIDLDDPPAAHLALARRTRHRYLPVYRGSPDAIEGMLDVTRFLLEPAHDARHVTTPALFVPETATLDDMLITLQRSDRHIACVLDEYGGTAGLISRGDILGHITGELHQGPAAETPALTPAGEDRWLIDGNTSLDEINHALDLELEAEGADRIAGWVSAQAGRFPRAGEIIEAQGCRVLVRRMRKLRIEQVMLELLRRPDETGADAAQVREDEPL